MTDREKLIELITDKENDLIRKIVWFTDTYRIKEVADHLIANGVTVQEWISVTERYPDEAGFYMGFYEARPGYWRVSTLHWSGENWNNIGYIPPSVYCTHWMPLPQPPKGE